jgi:D-alanyl-D-alanine carboxypeptidase
MTDVAMDELFPRPACLDSSLPRGVNESLGVTWRRCFVWQEADYALGSLETMAYWPLGTLPLHGFAVGAYCADMTYPSRGRRFVRARNQLNAFIAQEMRTSRTPGVAVAVITRGGFVRRFTYGFADVKTRRKVTRETLFEIGSISKSFTAIVLLQLHERGKLDLHEPLERQLPWFQMQQGSLPVTVHHLLTHTAGLSRDCGGVSSSHDSVPGVKFSYSNYGYQVLGYLIERLTGQPYHKVVRRQIFEPLDMKTSEPAITHEIRKRLAVGYVPLFDDRPWHCSYPLVEATWLEYGAGDGSIAASPGDLATYLRMLLNRGAGPRDQILSENSFKFLTQCAVTQRDNLFYGYGLGIQEIDGHTIIGHDGQMVGYVSSMIGDIHDGIGVVVLANGPGASHRIAQYALRLWRAALGPGELPSVPASEIPTKVPDAADFAGTFTSADGETLRFVAKGEALQLVHGRQRIALERRGSDSFFAPHADFAMFLLSFGREAAEAHGKRGNVVEVFYGSDWFVTGRYKGPARFRLPKGWDGCTGHYRSYNPWLSNFRIVVRKGKLWLLFPEGHAEPLMPLASSLFRVGEKDLSERLAVGAMIDGKVPRVKLFGIDYYRCFTR